MIVDLAIIATKAFLVLFMVLNLAGVLGWIERLKPGRAILTNMHADLDYETLRRELPPQVEPGYDGIGGMVTI